MKTQIAIIAVYALFAVGWMVGYVYWQWMSFQLGSFWMFFWGTAPPGIVVSPFVGIYAFFFGIPDWVIYLWG